MAIYTAVIAGGNWSNNATWGGAGHPVAGDTANIPSTCLGNVVIDATSACAVLNCSGHTKNLVWDFPLTTTGNVTLPTGVGGTVTGTGSWLCSGTFNFNPGNCVNSGTPFTPNITSSVSSITFSSSIYINGAWNVNGNTTINGAVTIYQAGNVTLVASNLIAGTGSPLLKLNAPVSQTINMGSATYYCSMNLNIDSAGTVTISGLGYRTGTFSRTNGTIAGAGTVYVQGSCVITGFTSGYALPNINFFSNTPTVTQVTDLYVTTNATFATNTTFGGGKDIYCGTLTAGANSTITMGGNIYNTGNLALATYILTANGSGKEVHVGGNLGPASGSCGIAGTADWIWDCPTAGTWNNNSFSMNGRLFINGAGAFTIGNCVMQSGGYLEYVTGTITNATGTNYINLSGGTTLKIATMPTFWNSLYISNTGTYTTVGDINVNVIQFVSAYTATWTGGNITCTNLNSISAGGGSSTFSYQAGTTLTITNGMDFTAQKGAVNTIQSSTPSSKVYLNYGGTVANIYNGRTTFTDIDASGSAIPIFTWYGIATRCVNVYPKTGADLQNIIGVIS